MHPDTMIQWMDVEAGTVIEGPVKDLFQKYSHKAEYKDLKVPSESNKKLGMISFENVKITDGYGWTNIYTIYKQPATSYWRRLVAGDRELLVTLFTQLPIFRQSDIKNPESGFHGEIKYPYIIETIDQMHQYDQDSEHIRIFDLSDNEFRIPIISDMLDIKEDYEYKITTKSRFFNANKIQMFGDLIMTNEEIHRLKYLSQ